MVLHTHVSASALLWLQDMHFLYILAAANLYAQMHGLPGSLDQPALRVLLKLLLQTDPPHVASIFHRETAKSGEIPGPSPILALKG